MAGPSPLFVALAEVELHLPGARSLKDKRHDVRSVLERVRNRHHVLIVESDHQELHQRAGIALCAFTTDAVASRATVQRALDHLQDSFSGVVLDEQVSVVQVR